MRTMFAYGDVLVMVLNISLFVTLPIVKIDDVTDADVVADDADDADDKTDIPAQGLPPCAITGSVATTENIVCYRFPNPSLVFLKGSV